jgi:hypothetical protein
VGRAHRGHVGRAAAAAQTIEAFTARLRHQPDLLVGDLLAVVAQTMEPSSAALWLASGPPSDA